MNKKLLIAILTIAATLCCTPVFAACGENNAEHTHSYSVTVVSPTCTDKGYTLHSCDCRYYFKDNETDALGHKFEKYVSDENATCAKDGTKTAKCDRCGVVSDTVTEEGTKLDHTFINYVSDGNATCTEDGTKTAKCENCSATDKKAQEALGHSFIKYVSDGNATCTEDGTKTAECERCKIETDTVTEEKSALGHNFVNKKCTLCKKPQYTAGLAYTLNDDGKSYTVTGLGEATDTDISIEPTYNGKPVTAIGRFAFDSCKTLTSVTLPDGITSIGNCAFEDCDGLISINIPETVISIGEKAFDNCTALESITIPDGVTSIGWSAFGYCSSLASITIPDSVTFIDSYAFIRTAYFYDDNNWENNSLYIGKHLIKVKDTFTDNYEVKEGTLTIAGQAFYDCKKITGIKIPDSVIFIGQHAFKGCSKLTDITIPDGITAISNCTFVGCSELTSIAIPDSVTSIGEGAFSGCSKLTSITIPDGITAISNYTFFGCSELTSIVIPDSVTSIGESAFSGCSELSTITFGGTVGQWADVTKGSYWNQDTGNYTVQCSDGNISKNHNYA